MFSQGQPGDAVLYIQKGRIVGFIDYDGDLQINMALLSVVLHD